MGSHTPTWSRLNTNTPSWKAVPPISTLTIFARAKGKHSNDVGVSKLVALPFWHHGHTTESLIKGAERQLGGLAQLHRSLPGGTSPCPGFRSIGKCDQDW